MRIETGIEGKNCLILGSSHILLVICWSTDVEVFLQQTKSELSSRFWMCVCFSVGFWNFNVYSVPGFPYQAMLTWSFVHNPSPSILNPKRIQFYPHLGSSLDGVFMQVDIVHF